MCTGIEPMLLGSMGASVLGTVLQNQAAEDAADEQRAILAAGEEENQRINQRGEQAVNEFADKTFKAENRDASYEDAAKQREGSLSEALTQASTPVANSTGAVSSDYLHGMTTAKTQMSDDAAKRAKLMARAGAGSIMLGNESMRGGQLASDLAGLSQANRRNSNYARNAAGQVRNNGSLVGGLMSGLGSVGMMAGR